MFTDVSTRPRYPCRVVQNLHVVGHLIRQRFLFVFETSHSGDMFKVLASKGSPFIT